MEFSKKVSSAYFHHLMLIVFEYTDFVLLMRSATQRSSIRLKNPLLSSKLIRISNHGLWPLTSTVQRVLQCLILTLCTIEGDLKLFIQDVSQPYVQAETTTQRPIFVRPLFVVDLPENKLFWVDRPLYGLPKSWLHWFHTHHNHHQRRLALRAAIHDACFFLKKPEFLHVCVLQINSQNSPVCKRITRPTLVIPNSLNSKSKCQRSSIAKMKSFIWWWNSHC